MEEEEGEGKITRGKDNDEGQLLHTLQRKRKKMNNHTAHVIVNFKTLEGRVTSHNGAHIGGLLEEAEKGAKMGAEAGPWGRVAEKKEKGWGEGERERRWAWTTF